MVVNVFATSATVEQCSRNELLAFVNNYLRANLTRIEEMSTGAAYCQLTEMLFPGKISLKKVKWNSRNEVDWISNWRILQIAWKDIGVEKAVPVERLLRAKFQDNFEFLQWFKMFFDANYVDRPYDALNARNGEPLPASWPTSSRPVATKGVTIGRSSTVRTPTTKSSSYNSRGTTTSKISLQSGTAMQRKYEIMIEGMREGMAGLVVERDFYFDKLRKIELLCQEAEKSLSVSRKEVLDILYETQEGFAVIDEVVQASNKRHGDVINPEKGSLSAASRIVKNPTLDDSETF